MSKSPKHFYEFGRFRVDAAQRLLFLDAEVVPLTPKAFDLLLVLVENSGSVVTKEELLRQVWPDSFVEEANLSHNVYKLREALGERENGGKLIETVPRRGYRFVSPVTEVQEEGVDLFAEEHTRAHVVIEEEDERGAIRAESATPATDARALASAQSQ